MILDIMTIIYYYRFPWYDFTTYSPLNVVRGKKKRGWLLLITQWLWWYYPWYLHMVCHIMVGDYPWPWHYFEYRVEYHDHSIKNYIFPWHCCWWNLPNRVNRVPEYHGTYLRCPQFHDLLETSRNWAVNLQLPPCHVWWASSLPCLMARVSRAGHVKVVFMGKSGWEYWIFKKWKMCFLEKIVVKLWNMGNIRARMKCVFFLFPMLLKFRNGS